MVDAILFAVPSLLLFKTAFPFVSSRTVTLRNALARHETLILVNER